jgi:hypothetical protein
MINPAKNKASGSFSSPTPKASRSLTLTRLSAPHGLLGRDHAGRLLQPMAGWPTVRIVEIDKNLAGGRGLREFPQPFHVGALLHSAQRVVGGHGQQR